MGREEKYRWWAPAKISYCSRSLDISGISYATWSITCKSITGHLNMASARNRLKKSSLLWKKLSRHGANVLKKNTAKYVENAVDTYLANVSRSTTKVGSDIQTSQICADSRGLKPLKKSMFQPGKNFPSQPWVISGWQKPAMVPRDHLIFECACPWNTNVGLQGRHNRSTNKNLVMLRLDVLSVVALGNFTIVAT